MTDYVTVPDVQVLSAGRTWRGQTGVYYVTAEHLADVVAAQQDPLIRPPRLKLGHYDQLFGQLAGSGDPANGATDGEPGFGTLTNLRLDEGGAMLIADLTEVPDWLAEAMPSAYPTRSAEWVWDWTTSGGNSYTMVLTDVALGGVWRPAVEDLADVTRDQIIAALAALLRDGPQAAQAALTGQPAAASNSTRGTEMPDTSAASVSVDRICQVFNQYVEDPASIPGVDTYWWWARDIRVDPDEVIASDGEGGTYRVPFTTDGEHDVTFGTPVEVRQTYVDVAAAAAAASAAQARHGQRVLAHDLPRPNRVDPNNPTAAAAASTQEETSTMDVANSTLARRLGLPEDASEEQITEALNAEPDTDDDAETVPVADVEQRIEEAVAARIAASATGDDRVAQMDRTQFEELRADAAAGREARQQQLAASLDGLVDAAVTDGRIGSGSRDAWRQAIDPGASPDAAATARATAEQTRLATLEANRIPVDERGAAAAEAAQEETGGIAAGALPDNVSLLSPAERAQRAA